MSHEANSDTTVGSAASTTTTVNVPKSKQFAQLIKGRDIFEHQASLPMLKKEGRQKKSTLCGGIFSIVAIVLYSMYSYNNVSKLWNKNYDDY